MATPKNSNTASAKGERKVLQRRNAGNGIFVGNLAGAPEKVGDGFRCTLMVPGYGGVKAAISEKMVEKLGDAPTKARLVGIGQITYEKVEVSGKEYENFSLRGTIRYADSDFVYGIASGGIVGEVKVGVANGREYATMAVVSTVGKNGEDDVKVLTGAIGGFANATGYVEKGRRVILSGMANIEVGEKGARLSLRNANLDLGYAPKKDGESRPSQAAKTTTAQSAEVPDFAEGSDDDVPF